MPYMSKIKITFVVLFVFMKSILCFADQLQLEQIIDPNDFVKTFKNTYADTFKLEGFSLSQSKQYLNLTVRPLATGVHCVSYSVIDKRNQRQVNFTYEILVGKKEMYRLAILGRIGEILEKYPDISLGDSIILPVRIKPEYSKYRFSATPPNKLKAIESTYKSAWKSRRKYFGEELFPWLEGRNPVRKNLIYLGSKKLGHSSAGGSFLPETAAVFKADKPSRFNLKLYGVDNQNQFTIVPIRIIPRDKSLTVTDTSVGKCILSPNGGSSSGTLYFRQKEIVMRQGDKIAIRYWRGTANKSRDSIQYPKLVIEKLPFNEFISFQNQKKKIKISAPF